MSVLSILARLAIAGLSHAHTWVEQMQEINSNGSFTGAMGYPRGYVSRTEAGFNGNSMDYLLPPLTSGRTRINASDLLCHPAQRTANQTDGFPMLTTSAGNFIALKYLENGHVTLPQNQPGKPPGSGTVFIFATTDPKEDETLEGVLQWTSNGSGGDGRGRLITAQNFDDGRCHQIDNGAISILRQKEFPDRVPDQPTSNVEQWCETDVPVPTDMVSGTLTLYFVWDWPTRPGVPGLPDGKDEYYTTCMDIKITPNNVSSNTTVLQESADAFALMQQDPQTKAVKTYSSRLVYMSNPLGHFPNATSSTGLAPTATSSIGAAPTGTITAEDPSSTPSSPAASPTSGATSSVIGVPSTAFNIPAQTLSKASGDVAASSCAGWPSYSAAASSSSYAPVGAPQNTSSYTSPSAVTSSSYIPPAAGVSSDPSNPAQDTLTVTDTAYTTLTVTEAVTSSSQQDVATDTAYTTVEASRPPSPCKPQGHPTHPSQRRPRPFAPSTWAGEFGAGSPTGRS